MKKQREEEKDFMIYLDEHIIADWKEYFNKKLHTLQGARAALQCTLYGNDEETQRR